MKIFVGLIVGKEIYTVADCGDRDVDLCREGKIDIPVLLDDFIIIRGAIGKLERLKTPSQFVRLFVLGLMTKKDISFSKIKILEKELKSKDDEFLDERLFIGKAGWL